MTDAMRTLHLLSALALGLLIYIGWSDDSTAALLAKLGAFPVLGLTGAYLFASRRKAQHHP